MLLNAMQRNKKRINSTTAEAQIETRTEARYACKTIYDNKNSL